MKLLSSEQSQGSVRNSMLEKQSRIAVLLKLTAPSEVCCPISTCSASNRNKPSRHDQTTFVDLFVESIPVDHRLEVKTHSRAGGIKRYNTERSC